jgi:hypothetical protein
MDFLKKNYEKILLGVVLVGLAVAVVCMIFLVSNEQQRLTEIVNTVTHPNVKVLTNVDMTIAEQALKRAASPATVDFGPPNRLFNPMAWQKTSDGRIIPREKVGPGLLIVSNIQPLYLILTLDKVTTSQVSTNYIIGIERQAAATPGQRAKKQSLCTLDPPTKTEVFTMVAVDGHPDDPTNVVVQLKDSGERVNIPQGTNGFRRIDGYTADLRYPPENNKFWSNRRVNSQPPLAFNGEEYNIVGINQNEVVLAAKSNLKKTTIKAVAGANPAGAGAGP